MLAGVQPFKALTPYLSMEKTKKASYTFPPDFDPLAADLISKLLIVDPVLRMGDERRGRGGSKEVMEHAFFAEGGVVWNEVWTREAPKLEPGLVVRRERERERTVGDIPGGRRRSRSKSKLRERTISGRRSGERVAANANGNGDLATSGPSSTNVRKGHDQLVEDQDGEHAALVEAQAEHASASSSSSGLPASSVTESSSALLVASDGEEEDDDDEEDSSSSNSDDAFDYLDDSISDSDEEPAYTGRPHVESEDEMDDERDHHAQRHRRGRRTPSISSADYGGGEETDEGEGTVGARSTQSDSSERSRGRSHAPSSISPLGTPLETSATAAGPSSTAPTADVIAWDAHYGAQRPGAVLRADAPTSVNGDESTNVESSGRGASPSSSNATSSTGRSEEMGAWYVDLARMPLYMPVLIPVPSLFDSGRTSSIPASGSSFAPPRRSDIVGCFKLA